MVMVLQEVLDFLIMDLEMDNTNIFCQDQMLVSLGKRAYPSINQNDTGNFEINFSSFEIQQQIVESIESYITLYTQKILPSSLNSEREKSSYLVLPKLSLMVTHKNV